MTAPSRSRFGARHSGCTGGRAVSLTGALILIVSALSLPAAEPVIVDTDSGLFGDDGAALVMLLRSPAQIALQGIVITPEMCGPPRAPNIRSTS